MGPRITKLTLNADGTVGVYGPNGWGGHPDWASVWYEAVVTQRENGGTVFAWIANRNDVYTPPGPWWSTTAAVVQDPDGPPDQQLQLGPAGAFGVAWVTKTDGSKTTFGWSNYDLSITGPSTSHPPYD
jgi:hypothetical protein